MLLRCHTFNIYIPGEIIYIEPPETYDLTWMSFTLLDTNYLLFGMKICQDAVLALSAIPGVLDTLTYQVSQCIIVKHI